MVIWVSPDMMGSFRAAGSRGPAWSLRSPSGGWRCLAATALSAAARCWRLRVRSDRRSIPQESRSALDAEWRCAKLRRMQIEPPAGGRSDVSWLAAALSGACAARRSGRLPSSRCHDLCWYGSLLVTRLQVGAWRMTGPRTGRPALTCCAAICAGRTSPIRLARLPGRSGLPSGRQPRGLPHRHPGRHRRTSRRRCLLCLVPH